MKEQLPCQTCNPYTQEQCSRVLEAFGTELCLDPSLLAELKKRTAEEQLDIIEELQKAGALV
jgi:hypothetical protein